MTGSVIYGHCGYAGNGSEHANATDENNGNNSKAACTEEN
jgi:hypothetical protein